MTPRFARIMLFVIAFWVYIIDRIAKLVAIKMLHAGQSVPVKPGIFHITLVLNNGAAFGLFKDRAAFFVAVSAAAVAAIMVYAWRHKGMAPPLAVSFGLILGGALGNLVDRVSFGYVIDYFDFRVWPVFNVADSAITIGVTLLIATTLFTKRHNASRFV